MPLTRPRASARIGMDVPAAAESHDWLLQATRQARPNGRTGRAGPASGHRRCDRATETSEPRRGRVEQLAGRVEAALEGIAQVRKSVGSLGPGLPAADGGRRSGRRRGAPPPPELRRCRGSAPGPACRRAPPARSRARCPCCRRYLRRGARRQTPESATSPPGLGRRRPARWRAPATRRDGAGEIPWLPPDAPDERVLEQSQRAASRPPTGDFGQVRSLPVPERGRMSRRHLRRGRGATDNDALPGTRSATDGSATVQARSRCQLAGRCRSGVHRRPRRSPV